MDGPPLCGCAGAAAGVVWCGHAWRRYRRCRRCGRFVGAATLACYCGADAAAGAFGAAIGAPRSCQVIARNVIAAARRALAAAGCSAGAVELCAIAGGRSADIVSSAAVNATIVARRRHFILLILTDMSTFL